MSEYWIVDPFEQQVDQWVLSDKTFVLIFQSNVIRLCFVNDIEVDFDTVW